MQQLTNYSNIRPFPNKQQDFNARTNKRIQLLYKKIKLNRLLIIGLIIWNLCLTLPPVEFTSANIPQFTEEQMEAISELEEIPTAELQF